MVYNGGVYPVTVLDVMVYGGGIMEHAVRHWRYQHVVGMPRVVVVFVAMLININTTLTQHSCTSSLISRLHTVNSA